MKHMILFLEFFNNFQNAIRTIFFCGSLQVFVTYPDNSLNITTFSTHFYVLVLFLMCYISCMKICRYSIFWKFSDGFSIFLKKNFLMLICYLILKYLNIGNYTLQTKIIVTFQISTICL